VLRFWLAAMALSTLSALRVVLADWSAFVVAFPGAQSQPGHIVAVALPILLLIAIVGIWYWRRWGLWLLVIATIATLAFDAIAHGPWLHALAAAVASLITVLLLWWNLSRFAGRDQEPAR